MIRTCLMLLFIPLLASCASIQKERALYFAPDPLPSEKTIFAHAYTTTLKAAQSEPTPVNVAAFIDAGSTLLARNCSEWLTRVSFAQRGLVLSDKDLGVAEGLATTLMGVARVSSPTVAVMGGVEAALAGLGANIQSEVLGAPSQYQAQSAILALQGACTDTLLADAPKLTFAQAYRRMEGCARVCSYGAASDVATRALTAVRP